MRRIPWTVLLASVAAATGLASCGDGGCDCADVSGLDLFPVQDTADVPAADESLPADLLVPDVPSDLPADVMPPDVPPADVPPDVPAADVPPEVTIPESLGGERPAALFVPDDYDARKAYPLLILLHGYSASGFAQDAYLSLSPRVTDEGFVFLRPDGTMNSEGYLFWNASPSCCDFENTGVDDVAYIRGLIAEAKAALNIDPDRVYLLGHSNGGFMSLRMACDASDQVTGILSIAGSIARETVDAAGCTPARPVSVVLVHGTLDSDIRYDGSADWTHPFLSAPATRDLWKGLDGCAGDAVSGAAADLDDETAGDETVPAGWTGCAQGTSVALWTMTGSGHVPLFNGTGQDALLKAVLGLRRDPAANR